MSEMNILKTLDSYPFEKLNPGVALIFYVDEFEQVKKGK